jgi:hypothetical protein
MWRECIGWMGCVDLSIRFRRTILRQQRRREHTWRSRQTVVVALLLELEWEELDNECSTSILSFTNFQKNETPTEVPHRRKRESSNLASSLEKYRVLSHVSGTCLGPLGRIPSVLGSKVPQLDPFWGKERMFGLGTCGLPRRDHFPSRPVQSACRGHRMIW